jgi:hypothetical protein
MAESPESESRKSFAAVLGYPVIFRVADCHLTTTLRAGVQVEGSVFHPELTEFAGIIGRVRPAGETEGSVLSADIALIIPGHSDLRWIENIPEGDGPGCFHPV